MKEETYKLFDSEIKVMREFWNLNEARAAEVCKIMQEKYGWKYGSTYSAIEKCIAKGCLERKDPGYVCRPIIDKKTIFKDLQKSIITKIFLEKCLNEEVEGSIEKLYHKCETICQEIELFKKNKR